MISRSGSEDTNDFTNSLAFSQSTGIYTPGENRTLENFL